MFFNRFCSYYASLVDSMPTRLRNAQAMLQRGVLIGQVLRHAASNEDGSVVMSSIERGGEKHFFILFCQRGQLSLVYYLPGKKTPVKGVAQAWRPHIYKDVSEQRTFRTLVEISYLSNLSDLEVIKIWLCATLHNRQARQHQGKMKG